MYFLVDESIYLSVITCDSEHVHRFRQNVTSMPGGMDQVMFMNTVTVHNDGDTGSIRFEPTPTFNQYTLDRRWIVSVCAAGML